MWMDYDQPTTSRKARQRSKWDRASLCGAVDWKNADFRCVHCRAYVTAQVLFAGVHNRNHCPYCLWSRHMDLYKAGDRLSACKCGMQPVGLTVKKQFKKYASADSGELMLIHRCADCGSFAINRIAADDDPEMLLEVYEISLLRAGEFLVQFAAAGIITLLAAERDLVLDRLFGTMERRA